MFGGLVKLDQTISIVLQLKTNLCILQRQVFIMYTLTGKKGGALASSIFSHMQHGDPFVKSLIKHILKMVSQPNYAMLMRWIYDGELEDTHDEVG